MTSPNYFVVSGKDYEDVRRKLFNDYGDRARILTRKEVPASGIFGLFGQRRLECTCYLSAGLTGLEKEQQKKTTSSQRRRSSPWSAIRTSSFSSLPRISK